MLSKNRSIGLRGRELDLAAEGRAKRAMAVPENEHGGIRILRKSNAIGDVACWYETALTGGADDVRY